MAWMKLLHWADDKMDPRPWLINTDTISRVTPQSDGTIKIVFIDGQTFRFKHDLDTFQSRLVGAFATEGETGPVPEVEEHGMPSRPKGRKPIGT